MKEIEDFLEEWKIDNENEIYTEYKLIKNGEEELFIWDELKKLIDTLDDIINWDYAYCGGFDSPGYSISCYCLIIITKDNKLIDYPMQFDYY